MLRTIIFRALLAAILAGGVSMIFFQDRLYELIGSGGRAEQAGQRVSYTGAGKVEIRWLAGFDHPWESWDELVPPFGYQSAQEAPGRVHHPQKPTTYFVGPTVELDNGDIKSVDVGQEYVSEDGNPSATTIVIEFNSGAFDDMLSAKSQKGVALLIDGTIYEIKGIERSGLIGMEPDPITLWTIFLDGKELSEAKSMVEAIRSRAIDLEKRIPLDEQMKKLLERDSQE